MVQNHQGVATCFHCLFRFPAKHLLILHKS
jgi:hypothetical protein